MNDAGNLVIFGAAALGKVTLDAALMEGWNCVGVFDDNPALKGSRIFSRFTVDTDRQRMRELRDLPGGCRIFVAIGTSRVRRKLSNEFANDGWEFATIRHPKADISPFASIGKGSVAMSGANIDPTAMIGNGTILNPMARVAHDCIVGDFCQISDGAILTGGVVVGNGVFVGAGAVFRPDVSVCDDTIVGAGTVVVKKITKPGVWAGVPAKWLKSVDG